MKPAVIHYVSKWELRAVFNALDLTGLAAAGACQVRVIHSRPVVNSTIPTVAGMTFQRVEYLTLNGQRIAAAHYRMLPDGTIGDSGRPDPTTVQIEEVVYRYSARAEDGRSHSCVVMSPIDVG